MKVLVNGGLNLSEVDGWWAEAYTPELGWALGDGNEHSEPGWDAIEADQLYRLLEQEVIPMFYDRDAAGLPRAWIERMRTSMATLTPRFSTNRMLRDYIEQLYLPAAADFARRNAEQGRLAKQLRQWELALKRNWHEIHLGQLTIHKNAKGWHFELQVHLGAISIDAVQVQLFADAQQTTSPLCQTMQRDANIPGVMNGYFYTCNINTSRPYTDFTPRLIPYHPKASVPTENPLIVWWSGEVKIAEESTYE
jgi:starch phosphorylase